MSRRFHCPTCGRESVTTDDAVEVLFHRCSAPPRFRIDRPPNREQERHLWAKTLLGAALEESIVSKYGDDAIHRREGDR